MALCYGITGLIATAPKPVTGNGPPPASFKAELGTQYFDQLTTPPTQYIYNGSTWNSAGGVPATVTVAGPVFLSTLAQLQTGTAPTGAYVPLANDVATVIAGIVVGAVPPATIAQSGIVFLSTDANAVLGTAPNANTAVQVSNLAAVFAAPPVLGFGFTTPRPVAATTLSSTGLAAFAAAVTVGTTLGVTGASTLAALTQVGTTLMNASGGAVTTIGTGGTGAVNIGNATGNTAVTGSLTASTSLTATLGNITATNGNLVLVAAGNKITRSSVATTSAAGANSMGSVVLVGGTVSISTTAVTTNSLITIWRQSVGATGAAALGELSVGSIFNGASFLINSWTPANATVLQASDVSLIGWEITN